MSIQTVGLPSALTTPFANLGRTDAGGSGYVQLQNGANNPALPNTPDSQWTAIVPGASGDAQKDSLVLRNQRSGPNVAVDAMELRTTGDVTVSRDVISRSVRFQANSTWALSSNAGGQPIVQNAGGSAQLSTHFVNTLPAISGNVIANQNAPIILATIPTDGNSNWYRVRATFQGVPQFASGTPTMTFYLANTATASPIDNSFARQSFSVTETTTGGAAKTYVLDLLAYGGSPRGSILLCLSSNTGGGYNAITWANTTTSYPHVQGMSTAILG